MCYFRRKFFLDAKHCVCTLILFFIMKKFFGMLMLSMMVLFSCQLAQAGTKKVYSDSVQVKANVSHQVADVLLVNADWQLTMSADTLPQCELGMEVFAVCDSTVGTTGVLTGLARPPNCGLVPF